MIREWVEAHHQRPIGVSDIAAAVGIGVRQLQAICQDQWGMTPTQLLRGVRLDHARAALSTAIPGPRTVSDVAEAAGYLHMSRFAAHYRQRFGETPTETLKRRRAHLGAAGSGASLHAALHLTGPAVSQQLAALEREAGIRLVRRQGRRLVLTDAGRVLVAHTDVLLDQLAAAEADLLALRTEIAGTVRIGAFASAAATFVAEAWRTVAAERDRLTLRLTGMEPEESLPALTRGDVEIAVAHSYDLLPFEVPPTCERHDLLTDPVAVVLPATDPVGRDGRAVDLAALKDHPWLSVPADTSCHQMLQRACGAAGFVPQLVAQTGDYSAVLALIAAGAGVTLMPRLGAQNVPPGVVLRPLARPVDRHISAITRHGGDRHPAVSVILDHLRTAARRFEDHDRKGDHDAA